MTLALVAPSIAEAISSEHEAVGRALESALQPARLERDVRPNQTAHRAIAQNVGGVT